VISIMEIFQIMIKVLD